MHLLERAVKLLTQYVYFILKSEPATLHFKNPIPYY